MRRLFADVSLRTIIKRSIAVAGFVVYVFAVAYFLRFMTTPPPEEVAVRSTVQQQGTAKKPVAFSAPIRLVIPSIKVNAVVASTGLTSDGSMDIKKSPIDVAWYKFGPSPGSKGSAVIAGHYGWENGRGSVFNDLHSLRPGNVVTVKNEAGALVSFVVRKTKLYDPEADASEIFTSSDGKSHLNLITCEGEWIEARQTYSRRLVVFSDKRS